MADSRRAALSINPGGELNSEQRQGLALLEAELRDQIRGRFPASLEALQAGCAARVRGVKVDLLDDRKLPLPESLREQAHKQLVDILNQAASGAVRARALSGGSSRS